jgi:predicted transcriptional regulator
MTTKTTSGRGIDNRVKSRLNQEKLLLALHRFGWLPVRQIHYACWPDNATARNAQEYAAQLLKLRQVMWKDGPDRSRVYSLTSRGARRLRVELGIEATCDSQFARRPMPSYHHRCLANDISLHWLNLHGEAAGFYTEHEIATGRAPIMSAPKYLSDPVGKVPDALLTLRVPVTATNPYSTWFTWVEVENSEKPKAAHKHMVRSLCDVLGFNKQAWEVGSAGVLRYAVVVCPHVRHEFKLVRAVLQFLSENTQNYDAASIVLRLNIWRPDTQEGMSLMEWIEKEPEFLALRDTLRLWWPALRTT